MTTGYTGSLVELAKLEKIGENVGKVVAKQSLEDPLVLDVVKHFGWTVLDGPFWTVRSRPKVEAVPVGCYQDGSSHCGSHSFPSQAP